ncbi:MAG TPA: nucleoside diphosphate kinase regulator [Pirellulales bacterium]|jgi:regulator of nucleoside diphosphate kinase|nr:nucleoside diphosphate kinase regulator [Pirellulales bacterium]
MTATVRADQITITDNDCRRLGSMLQSRIAFEMGDRRQLDDLESKLEQAQVVPPEKAPRDLVTMNSVVRLRDLDTDEPEVYRLVYPHEAKIADQRLSVLAPVGSAILGRAEGSVVEWPVPSGLCRLRIDEVVYQPEREGAFDL